MARDARHMDHSRSPEELWDRPVDALGVGPLLEVDTERPVDVTGLAARIRACA